MVIKPTSLLVGKTLRFGAMKNYMVIKLEYEGVTWPARFGAMKNYMVIKQTAMALLLSKRFGTMQNYMSIKLGE